MKEVTFKSNSKLDFESIRSEKLKRLSNNRIIDSFLKENNLNLEVIVLYLCLKNIWIIVLNVRIVMV